MFIPLHDANKLKHIRLQFVTLALIAINVLVYLFVNLASSEETGNAIAASFGYIPAVFNDVQELPPHLLVIPEELSLFTYAFLHIDFMHLASNMLFLWVFGDNVEDAMGHVKYLIFYLICAAVAAYAHSLTDPASVAPLIGASGAVSGIIGAYLILHPKVRVWVLVLGRIPLPLPAFIPLLFWIGFQIFMILTAPDDQVSWAAHIGGVIAGLVLVFIFKRRDVPLFDREVVTPRAATIIPEVKKPSRSDEGKVRHPWGRNS